MDNIGKDQMFRLTELNTGFLIGPADVVIPSKTAKPLIIGDVSTLMEYMSRYLWARTHDGKELKEAHAIAMKHVGITQMRAPERPIGLL